MDSYGLHEKLWQFSSGLLQKGFKIIEVSNSDQFLDVNISKTMPIVDKFILRASAKGEPEKITHLLNSIEYYAIKVGEKNYIPDRDKMI